MKKRKSTRLDPSTKRAVFVVDDNALLLEFASTVLEAAGYAVKNFSCPKEALRAMHMSKAKPSVLVTDYDMGTMNGLELILSSHQVHPSLKTVLVSGTVDQSITQNHAAKVHRFLGKPYQPAQLQKIVGELIQK